METSRWQRQLNNILETQIARYPFLVQFRAVWNQLLDERASWSLVLPVSLVIFLLTYRRERKRVKAILRNLAD
ncbi:MAG: hypothetical protein AB4911_07410 [Oscillochloridaceae bacterium umkhey_bin13]